MTRLVLLIASIMLALTGCTSSEGGSAGGPDDQSKPIEPEQTATPTGTPAPTGPDCADIWKVGATLPSTYTRCVTDGSYAVQEVTRCDDGSRLVAYDDEYFAVTGKAVSRPDVAPMQDTDEFARAYSACTGE